MAAINRRVRIYRKTVPADTFATLASTEKLEFNASKDNTVANGWTTKIGPITKGRGIADNPNPNNPLGENQDTGEDEYVVQIEGSISRADDVTNAFKINLNSFESGEQENLALPMGVFSIEIDRDPHENLISDVTKGLKVRTLQWTEDEDTPNKTDFIFILEKGTNP